MNEHFTLLETWSAVFRILMLWLVKPKEKKSLKRYFPYKEYTIEAEFGFSLLDKGVYVR